MDYNLSVSYTNQLINHLWYVFIFLYIIAFSHLVFKMV